MRHLSDGWNFNHTITNHVLNISTTDNTVYQQKEDTDNTITSNVIKLWAVQCNLIANWTINLFEVHDALYMTEPDWLSSLLHNAQETEPAVFKQDFKWYTMHERKTSFSTEFTK